MTDRTEYLTKVPREYLFTDGVELLLDNVAAFRNFRLIRARGVSVIRPWAAPISLVSWSVWPSGALFIGYSRMFEALVPLVLFGLVVLAYLAAWHLRKNFRR